MSAEEPVSESNIGGQQHVSTHSSDHGLGPVESTDLDALLSGHDLDPHFKRQLQELDSYDLSHLEEQSTRESTPATPSSQSGVVRNPLAPADDHISSNGSGSATPLHSMSRQSSHPLLPSAPSPSIASASPRHHSVAVGSRQHTPETFSSTPVPHKSPDRIHPPFGSPSAESTAALTSRQSSHQINSQLGSQLNSQSGSQSASRQGSLAPTDDDVSMHARKLSDPSVASSSDSRKTSLDLENGVRKSEDPAGESMPPTSTAMDDDSASRVSAYARLDFDSFTFYVQTLQVVLGRRSENGGPTTDVDVHLGPAKAISRRHAKIFYNFATQRFELTVIGRNGAFVGDVFVETGSTVPLRDSTKVQIGQIAFNFVLPMQGKNDGNADSDAEHDHIDEELEVEENDSDRIKALKTKPAAPALGSEKGRGGKLKQRTQSTKQIDVPPAKIDENLHPAIDPKLSASQQAVSQQQQQQQPQPQPQQQQQQQQQQQHVAPQSQQPTQTAPNTQQPPKPAETENARSKPRQLSFLKRADENNLFAHVPPDQLAAVNAQVDAAIAGLPDIPGFDPPPSLNQGNDLRNDNNNIDRLLALQNQLGLPNTTMSNLNNLMGYNSVQQPALGAAGAGAAGANNGGGNLQTLQNLQALQSLQGIDVNNLQNLQGLQGFQGLQPAAGLGLLQQLQALQQQQQHQNKNIGLPNGQQPQPRQKRKPKREYRPEEIPEQFRTKPAHSYSHLITAALRDRLSSMPDGTQGGLSLGDIYEAIMDLFPYYRYCQPGWQNSVRHNLSSSKSFRKVSKEGKGWLWGLDEEYLAEKEKQRQRAQQRQQQQMLAQQQAMAEQQAREQAREQARQIQIQRDRERELEQRRFLAERAARAAQVGVPLHQLSATLGTTNLHGLGSDLGLGGGGGSGAGSSLSGGISDGFGGSSTRSAGGDTTASKPAVLPPETVKLLAGLQQHIQQELAKDNQPPLNPQLLSNALAVVIAQTAKQAGGLQSLGTVLQQPGAVQKLLNQAMQLLRSTQRVPASMPAPKPTPPSNNFAVGSTAPPAVPSAAAAPAPAPAPAPSSSFREPEALPASAALAPPAQPAASAPSGLTTAQAQAQPHVQATSKVEEHTSNESATQMAQPHVQQPSSSKPPASVTPQPSSSETTKESTPAEAAKPAAPVKTEQQPQQQQQSQQPAKKPEKPKSESKKQQPSLEKISEILAKAEAIPNPTAEVKGMIEKLKSHKRQLELKRAGEHKDAPAPKRTAV